MDWQTSEDAVPSALRHGGAARRLLRARRPRPAPGARAIRPATAGSSSIGDVALEGGATLPARPHRVRDVGRAQRRARQRDARAARPHRRQPRRRPGRPGASDRGLVGRHRRPGHADRHRPLVRRRPQHARRLPGLDRPGLARARRRRVGLALPVPHDPRPGRARRSRSPTRSASTAGRPSLGGSMGGDARARVGDHGARARRARRACSPRPPSTTADQIALNSVQIEAIRIDPAFHGGDYYDAPDGDGPHRGLALARRMALLNYRIADRAQRRGSSAAGSRPRARSAAAAASPSESYLDFHGNKFTRRFDANSYIMLVEAMNSHDVGRDRGGVAAALARVTREEPRARHRQRPALPARRAGRDRRGTSGNSSTATCRCSCTRSSATTRS